MVRLLTPDLQRGKGLPRILIMRTNMRIALAALVGLVLVGCGQNTGWVVKPVPLNEALEETAVASDRGLFITDKIAIVDVDGVILNQRDVGLFGARDNPVSLFIEKLDKAQADPSVKAVIVRINSPGGGVTASDIMYQRLLRFRSARKAPVIAIIEDVGASGGYYVACGADEIVAHPTSVTGSIGVIVQTLSLAGTMQKIGITAKAVTSGKFKDMISPFKPLSDEDLAVVQKMVDEFYSRFLKVVGAGRGKLSQEKIKSLADGRVFTGEQALAEGLVDQVGYMDDAILLAKKSSGSARVKVVIYHRPLGYRANAYSAAPDMAPQVNLLNVNLPNIIGLSQPQFLYLWTGRAAGP